MTVLCEELGQERQRKAAEFITRKVRPVFDDIGTAMKENGRDVEITFSPTFAPDSAIMTVMYRSMQEWELWIQVRDTSAFAAITRITDGTPSLHWEPIQSSQGSSDIDALTKEEIRNYALAKYRDCVLRTHRLEPADEMGSDRTYG